MDTTTGINVKPSAGNNLESTLNKASSGAHAAVNTVAKAADDAASKAKPAIEQAASMAHQAVDKAADAAAPTAEWLSTQGDNIVAAQKKLISDTCDYVSANPLKAVGIALAAGFLLSRAMR